ncbi:MAG: hypothetical protein HUJ61_08190 [Bacilli bacterium]|nr:hypothetical protein [Bacilli bacterium]
MNEYLGINQLFAANQYFPRISYHDNMVHLRICSELCKNKYENITLNNMYCNDDDVEFYNGRYIYTADDIGDTPLSSKYESKCVSITSPLSLSFKGDESLWIFYNHRVKNDAFEEGWYERQVILDVDIDGHQYFLADTFSFQVS